MLWVIVSFMTVMFVLSIKKDSLRNFKSEIISLGILGTFIGISVGLYSFDVMNIKTSMPILLGGLKTAFITSGVGISLSILISIIRPAEQGKITLADISRNQEQMVKVLEASLNNISTSANNEIIASLEHVVKQFNKNLTDQFGQNFKELNSAVKALVVWQSNYKDQIEANEQGLSRIFISLNEVTKIKQQQEKNIDNLINNLSKSSNDITKSLKQSTLIVEENMQLLLREANGR
jgi:hypothetical protein